jgi:hypothetical protein
VVALTTMQLYLLCTRPLAIEPQFGSEAERDLARKVEITLVHERVNATQNDKQEDKRKYTKLGACLIAPSCKATRASRR